MRGSIIETMRDGGIETVTLVVADPRIAESNR